jgi:hypothetical protein
MMGQRGERAGRPAVLILPHDAAIGALMSELVGLAGYLPVFARADESLTQAVRRIRPAIVLVDCDHEWAFSDPMRAAIAESGGRVVLFSGGRSETELRQHAAAAHVGYFSLPNGPRRLAVVLAEAVSRPP